MERPLVEMDGEERSATRELLMSAKSTSVCLPQKLLVVGVRFIGEVRNEVLTKEQKHVKTPEPLTTEHTCTHSAGSYQCQYRVWCRPLLYVKCLETALNFKDQKSSAGHTYQL